MTEIPKRLDIKSYYQINEANNEDKRIKTGLNECLEDAMSLSSQMRNQCQYFISWYDDNEFNKSELLTDYYVLHFDAKLISDMINAIAMKREKFDEIIRKVSQLSEELELSQIAKEMSDVEIK